MRRILSSITKPKGGKVTDTWILQVADLHLLENPQNNLPSGNCARLMSESIRGTLSGESNLVMAICGDLTSKGQDRGYDLSVDFCRRMEKYLDMKLEPLICPGNHDINLRASNAEDPFSGFNVAAWKLGQTEMFSVRTATITRVLGDFEFILTNSAYHLDHTFGEIDVIGLEDTFGTGGKLPKIILVHHHFIPNAGDECSSIRNSYEFLQLCLAHDVRGILHGHGHMEAMISIGDYTCPLIGVGSLFYPPEPNFNNQFNLIRVIDGRLDRVSRFRFLADRIGKNGERGVFVPTIVPLLIQRRSK